ncbi:MAG: dihydroorotate dehydrogenase electron transfer subunit [Eubacterium sp.]|nr:dihydroorotate dehydrogenase electron transfer subunit [Eubacterium sp.]
MIKTKVRIINQEKIAEGIFDMALSAPEIAKDAKAGQFVNVYLPDKSRILPRPISICGYNRSEGTLRLVYRVTGEGKGTEMLSSLKAGDELEILGPLGNGYDISGMKGKKIVLFGGGIGIPPMLGLARSLYELTETKCDVVLGYRTDDLFLENEFRTFANVHISTDDGSFGVKGTVIDAAKNDKLEADVVMACGPMPMLRGVKEFAKENGAKGFISLEERMACGVGACLGCVCKTTETDDHSHVKNARVCKDGPVFDIDAVQL